MNDPLLKIVILSLFLIGYSFLATFMSLKPKRFHYHAVVMKNQTVFLTRVLTLLIFAILSWQSDVIFP